MITAKYSPAIALTVALAIAVAVSPPALGQAPAGTEATRYCMRLEAATGSRVETVRCWTRAKWEAQGVDLDAEWPREGIRTVG